MLWNQKIKPMLAETAEPFDNDEWLYELKLDGTRCISYIGVKTNSVTFLNRRLNYFQHRYPELLEIWKDVKGTKVILDGEIVIFKKGKPDFRLLSEREHVDDPIRIELLSKINPATYVVFDILYKDGKNLIGLPLIERKKILESTVKESSRILLSAYVVGKGKKFFQEIKKKKLEGVVAKRLQSTYQIDKRSKDWLKIKSLKTLDVVVIGYSTGFGKRKELLGSLLTACYHKNKLIYTGRVGTGFTEEELKDLLTILSKLKKTECPIKPEPIVELPNDRIPIWVEPKLVCEIKFMNLTAANQMRAPVFMRLRDDKLPKECELI